VLVADDDPLARVVLRRALNDGGIKVIAEAASASETTELAAKRLPDVVLMDAALHERTNGAGFPCSADVRVLVLANVLDPDQALRSLRCGANGYLTKDINMSVLPSVVRAIADGEAAVSRRLTMELIERLRSLPDGEVGTRPVKSELTTREWEVLDLLCLERSTTSIAEELFVTTDTVRSHIRNITRKLRKDSREEAVEAAQSLRRSADGAGAG
jgi:DNA-binding NarL/FixJ family response regulator